LAKNTPFLTLFKKGQKIEIFTQKSKKQEKQPFFYLLKGFKSPFNRTNFIEFIPFNKKIIKKL